MDFQYNDRSLPQVVVDASFAKRFMVSNSEEKRQILARLGLDDQIKLITESQALGSTDLNIGAVVSTSGRIPAFEKTNYQDRVRKFFNIDVSKVMKVVDKVGTALALVKETGLLPSATIDSLDEIISVGRAVAPSMAKLSEAFKNGTTGSRQELARTISTNSRAYNSLLTDLTAYTIRTEPTRKERFSAEDVEQIVELRNRLMSPIMPEYGIFPTKDWIYHSCQAIHYGTGGPYAETTSGKVRTLPILDGATLRMLANSDLSGLTVDYEVKPMDEEWGVINILNGSETKFGINCFSHYVSIPRESFVLRNHDMRIQLRLTMTLRDYVFHDRETETDEMFGSVSEFLVYGVSCASTDDFNFDIGSELHETEMNGVRGKLTWKFLRGMKLHSLKYYNFGHGNMGFPGVNFCIHGDLGFNTKELSLDTHNFGFIVIPLTTMVTLEDDAKVGYGYPSFHVDAIYTSLSPMFHASRWNGCQFEALQDDLSFSTLGRGNDGYIFQPYLPRHAYLPMMASEILRGVVEPYGAVLRRLSTYIASLMDSPIFSEVFTTDVIRMIEVIPIYFCEQLNVFADTEGRMTNFETSVTYHELMVKFAMLYSVKGNDVEVTRTDLNVLLGSIGLSPSRY